MVGVITGWDIMAHPISTIRCFGWGVFFRAVVPWNNDPFLSVLHNAGILRAGTPDVPTILERCIALELRAKRIYRALAKTFSDHELVEPFFIGLAEHEQFHADLLKVCRSTAILSGWKAGLFNPWQDYLPRLEQQMKVTEAAVDSIDSVEAALQLVIEIESSEINEVFHAALAATDTAFVKRLRPFRKTMEAHMSHIVERLPELSPQLILPCRELRVKYPRVRR
jgi:hypothetical protein